MTLRIDKGVTRGEAVAFTFEGRRLDAYAGETVATALIAAGIKAFRRNPVDGGTRGPFCLMGICQDCLVLIDGRPVEACRAWVRDGLEVRSLDRGPNEGA